MWLIISPRQLESKISGKTISIWPLQRQSSFGSKIVLTAMRRDQNKDSGNDFVAWLIGGFPSLPTPVVGRISGNLSHGFHLRRKRPCQARLHLGQAGIIGEVGEFVRVVFKVVQLLETVAVPDEPIARIGHRQRRGFLTPKLKRSQRELLFGSAWFFQLWHKGYAAALFGNR